MWHAWACCLVLVCLFQATPSNFRVFLLTVGQFFSSLIYAVIAFIAALPGLVYYFTLPSIVETFGIWRFFVFPIPFALWAVLVNALMIVLFKWLLVGTWDDQVTWVYSARHFCKWIVDTMITGSLTVLRPLYASLYLPPWFRCLGAKLAAHVEISTLNSPTPDMLRMEQGAFIADSAFVGVDRTYLMFCHSGPVTIGAKTFVGNSALVPTHTRLGNSALIGVLSTGPRNWGSSEDDAIGSVAELLSRGSKGAVPPARSDHRLYRDAPSSDVQAAFVKNDLPMLPRTGVAPAFFVAGARNPQAGRDVALRVDDDDDDTSFNDQGRLIDSPFGSSNKSVTGRASHMDGVDMMPGCAGGCCDCSPIPMPWPLSEDKIASQTALCAVDDNANYIGSPGIRMPRRYQAANTLTSAATTFEPPTYGSCFFLLSSFSSSFSRSSRVQSRGHALASPMPSCSVSHPFSRFPSCTQ